MKFLVPIFTFLLIGCIVTKERQIAPDGDPQIGVPTKRVSANFRPAQGPNLIEIDRATGKRIGDFSVPTEDVLSQEQMVRLRKAKEKKKKAIDSRVLRFRSGYTVHPTAGIEPAVSQKMRSVERDVYLVVQFGDTVKRPVLDELEKAGIAFYDYVHYHGYYAKVPREAFNRLERLLSEGEIRYIGTIPLRAKMEESFRQKVSKNTGEIYQVALRFFPDDTPDYKKASERFAEVFSQTPERIVGRIQGEHILEISQWDSLSWIEEWIKPKLYNLEGRMAHGADIIADLGTYSGAGINVATIDTGIAQEFTAGGINYHPDLPGTRILDQWDFQNSDATANDQDDHGTHVAGSLGGEGNSRREWSGMAPGSNLHVYKLCCGSNQFSWFEQALQRAGNHNVQVINNSWGSSTNGGYNTNSEIADRAVRGGYGPWMNLVVAAGNDNKLVGAPATAKNVITVGAVYDGNWPNRKVQFGAVCRDYVWPPGERACFSNFGPIDTDGNGRTRIKPDVVSTGPRTMSTVRWYLTNGNYYDLKDGTSMAAPKVAGLIALFLEAYPQWQNWPEMVKARLIATAIDIGNADQYGHGIVDAVHFISDEPGVMENVLNGVGRVVNNNDSRTYNFRVPSGFHEVRIVLTWADPPGSEEAINDLDLHAYDANGKHQGTSSSFDDVVEKVVATGGTSGTWRVVVDPWDLGQPGQEFALTAYVIMDRPSLDLDASISKKAVKPGDYFYVFTELKNDGGSVAGSYVQLGVPRRGIDLLGARLYPAEGYSHSHYYRSHEIHAVGKQYSVATNALIGTNRPLIRWFLRVSPNTDCKGDLLFSIRGYAQNVSSHVQKTLSVTLPGESECSDGFEKWERCWVHGKPGWRRYICECGNWKPGPCKAGEIP